MTQVKSPNLVIYREEYETTMRFRGLGPSGMLVISVPVSLTPDTLFWGTELNPSGLHCMLPGEIDAYCTSGQCHILILMPLDLLHTTLDPDTADRLHRQISTRSLPARPDKVHALSYWLNHLLRIAHQAPQMFNHYAVIKALERDVLNRIMATVDLGASPPEPCGKPKG